MKRRNRANVSTSKRLSDDVFETMTVLFSHYAVTSPLITITTPNNSTTPHSSITTPCNHRHSQFETDYHHSFITNNATTSITTIIPASLSHVLLVIITTNINITTFIAFTSSISATTNMNPFTRTPISRQEPHHNFHDRHTCSNHRYYRRRGYHH